PPFIRGGFSKRAYLMKRLAQFSDLIWRISVEDQGPKMVLEKRLYQHQISTTNSQTITNVPITK
ncbi:MAG: hypothetical protein ACPL6D_14270, partial [Thermodesulfobacteriota bacterium]